jgi:hypothetical protein
MAAATAVVDTPPPPGAARLAKPKPNVPAAAAAAESVVSSLTAPSPQPSSTTAPPPVRVHVFALSAIPHPVVQALLKFWSQPPVAAVSATRFQARDMIDLDGLLNPVFHECPAAAKPNIAVLAVHAHVARLSLNEGKESSVTYGELYRSLRALTGNIINLFLFELVFCSLLSPLQLRCRRAHLDRDCWRRQLR